MLRALSQPDARSHNPASLCSAGCLARDRQIGPIRDDDMTCAQDSCFACSPSPVTVSETPWAWSEPQSLCLTHKTQCCLPEGERLDHALHRAAPKGYPPEGSLLGYVYNPVFSTAADGTRINGWTDFAGGGMAVYEDRFGAATRTEFAILESPASVDLLYLVLKEAIPPPQRPA